MSKVGRHKPIRIDLNRISVVNTMKSLGRNTLLICWALLKYWIQIPNFIVGLPPLESRQSLIISISVNFIHFCIALLPLNRVENVIFDQT